MKPSHSTGRNVIAILAIPIVMLFLIVITLFLWYRLALRSLRDDRRRLACTSLSFVCRGVFYEYAIPPEVGSPSYCVARQGRRMLPYFCLEPQALNYLIDDQPLDSITSPTTTHQTPIAHMNQVLDKLLGQCRAHPSPLEPSIAPG